jgi:OOP family OmpA-OmpF porin
MFNPMKTLRALGRVAPIALSVAIMAPTAQAEDETYWYAKGDPTVPDGQLWTTSYGECWQSLDGPTNLPPCVVVPDEVTVKINFEFDKYLVPDNVVNPEVVAEIDEYIAQVKATPQEEYVTVVGHTDAKGSDEYNMALGQRRADAVRNYIIAQGYPAENLAPAESRGKRDLLPDIDPFSVEQRRVVLTKSEM